MRPPLPRTVAVLEAGIVEGLHLGAQGYVAVDGRPVADLVVGEACAGVPGTDRHYRRFFELTRALYVDLGLAAEDDPGREKALPTVAGMASA